MKKKFIWISGMLVITGVIMAQVPNTFKAGDKLSSAKLNENFTYLSKIVKDGLGNTLGQLAVAIPSQIYVLNSNGYRFGINIDGSVSSGSGSSGGSSVIRQPASGCTAANTIGCYYSDATCSIAGLLPANAIYANLMPGGVTYDSITLALYYVDKNAVVTPVSVYSSSAAMCTFMFIANVGTINDPAITGVQPSYPLPITIVNQ